MADVKDGGGLQIIFAIFLGLMAAAFVGIGVNTFNPSPQQAFNRRMNELGRQEQAIRDSRPADGLSAADRTRIREIGDERARTAEARQAAVDVWIRNTSIVLIAFATLVMAISLVRAERLPVISNGLLLGGVFTMIYAVGLIVAAGASIARFVIMTVALVITLVLGYIRFASRRALSPAPLAAPAGVADLEQRVRGLETRMDQAANALAHRV